MLSLDEMVSSGLGPVGAYAPWHQWLMRLSRRALDQACLFVFKVSAMCRISRSRKLKRASLGKRLDCNRASPCLHVVFVSSVIDELKS